MMRIVVVEDEIRIREGISRLLKKLNEEYEIVGAAENGQEGLALIRELKPDVVITDIRMPVMDGLEMLDRLHQENAGTKAIVLSAYSEFEYARKAMQSGVTEYLLKPISFGEFSRALTNIRHQLEKEQDEHLEGVGTLEQAIGGLIWGGMKPDPQLKKYMEKKFGLAEAAPLIQICVYLGWYFDENRERAKKNLELIMKQRPDVKWVMIESPYEKSLMLILYDYPDAHLLERWFQYQILQNQIRMDFHATIGWIQTEGYAEVKSGFDTLYPYMDWNIVLGEEIMISYPKITRVQTVPCVYPVELENQLKIAICANDMDKTRNCISRFHQYFRNEKVYTPKEVKECYVRFLWAFIDIGKEVGCLEYQKLEQQKMLESIMEAKNHQELEAVSDSLTEKIRPASEDNKEVIRLTVKRAKSMIQEFYQTGITLDEIAGKLDITPEYLGNLFHQDMGITFSGYIRDFRISKAKELLIGSQLKLYEIAEQVGYSNAKYFSRVFRDSVGQLPAEYRKTHK